MRWYIRLLPALAGMAGAWIGIDAQLAGTVSGNLLPVALAGKGYHAGTNQALNANESQAYFSASHSNLYGIASLSHSAIEAAIPLSPGTIAVSCISLGYREYHESLLGLSFARAFGKRFKAGLQLDYLRAAAPEREAAQQAVTFEGGMVSEPVRNLYLAFHLANPLQNGYAGSKYQHLPSVLRFAAGYTPGKKTLLIAEIEKDVQQTPVVKASIDFKPAELFILRYGISSTQGHLLALVLCRRQAVLEAGVQRHPVLGYSAQGTFCWLFKGRKVK